MPFDVSPEIAREGFDHLAFGTGGSTAVVGREHPGLMINSDDAHGLGIEHPLQRAIGVARLVVAGYETEQPKAEHKQPLKPEQSSLPYMTDAHFRVDVVSGSHRLSEQWHWAAGSSPRYCSQVYARQIKTDAASPGWLTTVYN